MADRPNFDGMKAEVALPLIGEMLYNITVGLERLTGNGRRGLCEERGEELIQVRERVAKLEANVQANSDTDEVKGISERMTKIEATAAASTECDEVEKLRARTGVLEDFKAWVKGALAVLGIVHLLVLAALSALGAIVAAKWK